MKLLTESKMMMLIVGTLITVVGVVFFTEYLSMKRMESYTYCAKEIQETIAKYGQPEDYKFYDHAYGRHDYTYYYPSQGIDKNFVWHDRDDGCQVYTNRYKPKE